jgi:hypothetical protein
MPKISNFLNKQFLTPEDGQLSPKHVVFLKSFIKVTSVKNTIKCFKH